MACVDSMHQSGFEQYHDAMAMRRNSIQRMSTPTSAILRTAQEVKLINFRIYESQPEPTTQQQNQQPPQQQQQPRRSSFVKRCSQLATGRRPSIPSSHSSLQAPPLVQWVQRLPSSPSEHEAFLECALEEAVGQLVCGPNSAAEEAELGYNYDCLEDTLPEAWVRVRAQLVESNGKAWIAASVSSKVGPGERADVYAYGKWMLVKTKMKTLH